VTQGLLDNAHKLSYYIIQYYGPREPDENQHEAICVKMLGVVPGGLVVELNDYTFSDKRPPLPEPYLNAFRRDAANPAQKTPK
jgi:hypothetical protein